MLRSTAASSSSTVCGIDLVDRERRRHRVVPAAQPILAEPVGDDRIEARCRHLQVRLVDAEERLVGASPDVPVGVEAEKPQLDDAVGLLALAGIERHGCGGQDLL